MSIFSKFYFSSNCFCTNVLFYRTCIIQNYQPTAHFIAQGNTVTNPISLHIQTTHFQRDFPEILKYYEVEKFWMKD